MLSEVVTERLPSAVAAAHCTYPGKLPVWPYTVPHGVRYRNSANPAEFWPGPGGLEEPATNRSC